MPREPLSTNGINYNAKWCIKVQFLVYRVKTCMFMFLILQYLYYSQSQWRVTSTDFDKQLITKNEWSRDEPVFYVAVLWYFLQFFHSCVLVFFVTRFSVLWAATMSGVNSLLKYRYQKKTSAAETPCPSSPITISSSNSSVQEIGEVYQWCISY